MNTIIIRFDHLEEDEIDAIHDFLLEKLIPVAPDFTTQVVETKEAP